MEEQRGRETHILAIPFPLQGHINPMLQLSKRLVSKGVKVTLVTPKSSPIYNQSQSSSVNFESISDGSDAAVAVENSDDFLKRFRVVFPQSLAKLVERQKCSNCPVKFIVYDSVLPWMLDVARELGLDGAPLFTQPWAVNAIYYHLYKGSLKVPSEGCTVALPSMPLLGYNDLPTLIYDETGPYASIRDSVVNQMSNIHQPKWMLCNTFDKLEEEVVKWMASHCPVKSIGPTVPSTYLDKSLENDKDYGLSLFKTNRDASLTWLDSKEIESVVYVSFGSMAALEEEQMEEVAWGLKRSNCYFLWVVRESEKEKLPSNFSEEILGKGLVVSWSPQLEVLAHKSVGCFMTHCGWNSTLESLSLGVPMVAMPQWTDQTTNAKFVADVWKVGIRATVDEKGIVTREEIEKCIREVMEGEKVEDIRRNSLRWKELAKEAVDDGGSSDKNLDEIVAELIGSRDLQTMCCPFM